MSTKDKIKWTYRVVRSILFTAIVFVTFLFVSLYVTLSIPSVQNQVRKEAEKKLTELTGGEVSIGNVEIFPFNEVILSNVSLKEPATDKKCIDIKRVGAGISLWNLVRYRKIVITYAELIGPDIRLRKDSKDGPLNIQFLIDAFKPKDKNKPPTKFDLQIRNIVIRKGMLSYDNARQPRKASGLDVNHIKVNGLSADVALPRLSNDVITIDLRRLAFKSFRGIELKRLSAIATIDHKDIDIKDFNLEFPSTRLTLSDLHIPLSKYKSLDDYLSNAETRLEIKIENGRPSEFAPLLPVPANLDNNFNLNLTASGNKRGIALDKLNLTDTKGRMSLSIAGFSANIEGDKLDKLRLEKLQLKSSSSFNSELAVAFAGGASGGIGENLSRVLRDAGDVNVEAEGYASLLSRTAGLTLNLASGFGNVDIDGTLLTSGDRSRANLHINSDNFNFGKVIDSQKTGVLDFNLDADVLVSEALLDGRVKKPSYSTLAENIYAYSSLLPEAQVTLNVPSAELNGYNYRNLNLEFNKRGSEADLLINSSDSNFDLDIAGDVLIDKLNPALSLSGDIRNLRPGSASLVTPGQDFALSGNFDINADGADLNDIVGEIRLTDICFEQLAKGKRFKLSNLRLNAIQEEDDCHLYTLDSDWIEGNIRGCFSPAHLPVIVQNMLARALPTLIDAPKSADFEADDFLDFEFRIARNGSWEEFLNLPIRLLYDVRISGSLDADENNLKLDIKAPYIQQGRDKLIRNTSLSAGISGDRADIDIYSSIPTKKGILDLGVAAAASDGLIDLDLDFNPGSKGAFYGNMALQAEVSPALNEEGRKIKVKILPSQIFLNGAVWDIGQAQIDYALGRIGVEDFSVSHDDQYLTINGVASPSPEDEIIAKLNDIDLNYIFETLNIDVAQFGGRASGEAVGRNLLAKNIEAFTRRLHVKNLSYNGTVLGDGDLRGDFDMATKRVGIFADINEDGKYAATVDGGIWIGKDSLSFNFDADKVRIGFLQYYMKAFASKVEGRASGEALLYGTFHDVNMKGRLFADTIALKVDYTNVTYSGKDSVIIEPNRIDIGSFRLYDDYGHSGVLSGVLKHNYFHNPEFDFTISDAKSLLLYDTNASMNDIWYGRIFGTGTGRIVGNDQYVRIVADMSTEANSDFTFVLNDSKEALNYGFLTFTDKRKEAMEIAGEEKLTEEEEIVRSFEKKVAQQQGPPSIFAMDIRATITPDVKMTLVMDPVAGDKILARGGGPVQIAYDSASDEMKMYGKYTLNEGVYNFSLQDLILKDFIIKEGSSVSFNGDPMAAMLNIRAAYRVNTNLTDLDMSFATDKDLNRVNVPVDAMLLVSGEMEHPDIKFDIELPTLNSEIEQKVRSIISSEDMMNTQMIYLLALNRFYTPEYNGNSNSGGEWASVASSTLSSQLQNILGQMTDKVTIAPSLRSDKGDFSDLQVDVALSSRLFNNRLLINGNLGYRDPSTSSTTFIGDFDIEYLLNRSGNFRLKAYNHFNDQNYYLKSALTTQGLGIVWRKEFDRLFPKRSKKSAPVAPTDSIN